MFSIRPVKRTNTWRLGNKSGQQRNICLHFATEVDNSTKRISQVRTKPINYPPYSQTVSSVSSPMNSPTLNPPWAFVCFFFSVSSAASAGPTQSHLHDCSTARHLDGPTGPRRSAASDAELRWRITSPSFINTLNNIVKHLINILKHSPNNEMDCPTASAINSCFFEEMHRQL